ncbi:MAG: hypothetical protein IJ449_13705 [Clostridia bacterium]|nr:hypothetical protein [Clostridia bacterium]
MKKYITLLAVSALCVAAMTSCGEDNSVADYNYNFDEYVTLGTYKGVEVSVSDIQAEIDAEYDSILTSNTYDVETEAAAVDGNKVIYSMTATVDGAAADSLAKTDATFTVGSSSTDYEELTAAFAGMSAGETKEVTVTVADDYTGDETIAGKEAVLTVTVSSVTTAVTPDTLTDDMVSTATSGEYTTVADYETYLYSAVKQNLVWDTVIANTTFITYPKKEAEIYYNNYIASYESTASQYGITIDSLVSLYGMTTDSFYNTLAQQAIAQVYQDLTMLSIAEKENLVPDDAKLNEVAENLAAYYGYEDADALMADLDETTLAQSAKYEMVLSFLEENAVEVE